MFGLFGPWRREHEAKLMLAEANRRALAAEERAGQMEQQVRWMQGLVEDSRKAEIQSMKIGWNISSQLAWGFTPFPDAPAAPVQRKEVFEPSDEELDFDGGLESQRTAFKQAEMKRFVSSQQQ